MRRDLGFGAQRMVMAFFSLSDLRASLYMIPLDWINIRHINLSLSRYRVRSCDVFLVVTLFSYYPSSKTCAKGPMWQLAIFISNSQ